jgi:hypothetical protein
MESAAHLKRNGLFGSASCSQVHRPSHGDLVPAYDNLIVAVDIGQLDTGLCADVLKSQLVQANYGGHTTWPNF